MTKPDIRMNWAIDIGTLIQTAVLLAGLVGAYVQFTSKMDDAIRSTQQGTVAIQQLHLQTQRIERYLSGTDPGYWQKVGAERGDN